MRELDLGCGNNKAEGSIGVDIFPGSAADLLCDLDHYPLPFRNNVFDSVVSKQVFEHLRDVEALLRDIRRICRDGARVRVFVPHFSCFYSYGDPSHRRTFSVFAFDKLAPRCGFSIVSKRITFHRALRRYGIALLANRFPAAYERFWAFILPAEHLVFEFRASRPESTKGNL
jgi:SAM-dependent methyltransferase